MAGESGKTYLGDGAYVEEEYGDAVLTTENGIAVTNRVVLGRLELCNLMTWAEARGLIMPNPRRGGSDGVS